MLVQHHIKYKEIHGVDEVVWMDRGKHNELHNKLRREGECNISVKELRKISLASRKRTNIDKINQINYQEIAIHAWNDSLKIQPGYFVCDKIVYNSNSGNISCSSYFLLIPLGKRAKYDN